jgi:hypothetical protein
MKNSFIFCALFVLLFMGSCSKDNNNAIPVSRNVKYEITGSATGSFTMVYTNASGALENITVQSLPWSKEVTVQNSVQTVAFSSSGSTTMGKSAVANLYIGGVVKQSANLTSDANGILAFAGLSFIY